MTLRERPHGAQANKATLILFLEKLGVVRGTRSRKQAELMKTPDLVYTIEHAAEELRRKMSDVELLDLWVSYRAGRRYELQYTGRMGLNRWTCFVYDAQGKLVADGFGSDPEMAKHKATINIRTVIKDENAGTAVDRIRRVLGVGEESDAAQLERDTKLIEEMGR